MIVTRLLEHVVDEVSYSNLPQALQLLVMDTEGFRHAEVTEFDRGALIQIPAWFLMVVLILVTFLKLAIRFKATHNPGADDALCFLAMVSRTKFTSTFVVSANQHPRQLLGVGGTVAVSLAVNDGLGRSATVRDHLHFADLQKVSELILKLMSIGLINGPLE